jgi:hypothetical protein
MTRFTRTRVFGAIAFVVLFWQLGATQAQIGRLSGPVWGLVFDEDAGSLHPLRGVPGSATFGDALELPVPLSRALVVDSRHAIVETASKELLVLDIIRNPPSTFPITDVPGEYSLAVLSADGTTGAFYRRDQHTIWIVKGLPSTPALQFVDSLAEGFISNLAVSNDGQVWIYSITTSDGDELYSRTTTSMTPRFLTSAASISGLLIVGGHAVVTDRIGNEVFAIWELEGAATRGHLAGPQEGIASPTGVVTSSGNQIHVANADSRQVLTLDFQGRILREHKCACAVSAFSRVSDASFRISSKGNGTLYVFDTGGFDERISFVPKSETTR